MTGSALEEPGILILHLALDAALAERLVFFRWGNAGPRLRVAGRTEWQSFREDERLRGGPRNAKALE